MLREVLRVEWVIARRDRSLWLALVALGLFMAFAAVTSRGTTVAERAALDAAHDREAARMAELAAGDPADPFLVGSTLLPRAAALPRTPLAPIAVGQRDVLPQVVELTTSARHGATATTEAASARPGEAPFDLAFVLVFLLPLVVVALSFDLLSAERERGTLALVLSQPVSLASFVLGKALLRALVLAAVLVALSAGGALAAGAEVSAPGGAAALGLFVALVLSYALFWFALALAVNAWGRSSAANALALVGAWLALVVVVPGLSSVAVQTLYPTPSRVELVNLTREAARDANARATEIEGDHGQPVKDAARNLRALEVQADLEARVHPVVEQFERRLGEQQSLVDRLRFTSPALLASEGLVDVAGSGIARHQHFTAQVDAFHDELQAYFRARVEAGAPLVASDYAAMPRFEYAEAPASALAGRVLASVAALVTMSVLLVGLAVARMRTRPRVR